MSTSDPAAPAPRPSNFIREIVLDDLRTNKFEGRVQTRFPPEPNGYLHLGHAKSICLNFGLAAEFGGKTNLRFDDTNPEKEEQEYVDSIVRDVRWMGFDWEERLFYASDYFDQLHDWAVQLIKAGKAYVCDLSAEEMRKYRGTLTEPGKDSPYRNRTAEENLGLFERMRAGEFPDGSRTLRAKIDMASPNLNMRDPVMYRILHAAHHRTGDKWCIYPMYDFAHGQSDSLEKVTHSICTLEFEDHRPLYNWYIRELGIFPSQQIEFDRLNLTYTLLSKRKLLSLVENGQVRGWDDPRMPTLAGLRRRGFPAEGIRALVDMVGVAKSNSVVEALGAATTAVRDRRPGPVPMHLRDAHYPGAARVGKSLGALEPLMYARLAAAVRRFDERFGWGWIGACLSVAIITAAGIGLAWGSSVVVAQFPLSSLWNVVCGIGCFVLAYGVASWTHLLSESEKTGIYGAVRSTAPILFSKGT